MIEDSGMAASTVDLDSPPLDFDPPPVDFDPPPVDFDPPLVDFDPPPVDFDPPPVDFGFQDAEFLSGHPWQPCPTFHHSFGIAQFCLV